MEKGGAWRYCYLLLKGEQLQPASLTVSMWDGTGWDNSLQQIQARLLVIDQQSQASFW